MEIKNKFYSKVREESIKKFEKKNKVKIYNLSEKDYINFIEKNKINIKSFRLN